MRKEIKSRSRYQVAVAKTKSVTNMTGADVISYFGKRSEANKALNGLNPGVRVSRLLKMPTFRARRSESGKSTRVSK